MSNPFAGRGYNTPPTELKWGIFGLSDCQQDVTSCFEGARIKYREENAEPAIVSGRWVVLGAVEASFDPETEHLLRNPTYPCRLTTHSVKTSAVISSLKECGRFDR